MNDNYIVEHGLPNDIIGTIFSFVDWLSRIRLGQTSHKLELFFLQNKDIDIAIWKSNIKECFPDGAPYDEYTPNSFKKSFQQLLERTKRTPNIVGKVSPLLCGQFGLFRQAVIRDGLLIKFADRTLQANEKLVRIAVKNNRKAMQFADINLQEKLRAEELNFAKFNLGIRLGICLFGVASFSICILLASNVIRSSDKTTLNPIFFSSLSLISLGITIAASCLSSSKFNEIKRLCHEEQSQMTQPYP